MSIKSSGYFESSWELWQTIQTLQNCTVSERLSEFENKFKYYEYLTVNIEQTVQNDYFYWNSDRFKLLIDNSWLKLLT